MTELYIRVNDRECERISKLDITNSTTDELLIMLGLLDDVRSRLLLTLRCTTEGKKLTRVTGK